MIVNTRRLFTSLLRQLGIGTVCDVGSMNGAEALAFSSAVPQSRVYAFEPNPVNFGLMAADAALRARGIQLLPLAASNLDGEADFYLVEAEYVRRPQHDARCGMSSLYPRTGTWAPSAVVRVGTTRLDSFLERECAAAAPVALWIDAEGAAYQVIEGVSGVSARIQLLHVEVETEPCIGSDQKLYPQVKALLEQLGFIEIATDLSRAQVQFNALFVRRDLPWQLRTAIAVRLLHARLRYLAVATVLQALRRGCPKCLERLEARRLARVALRPCS